MEEQLATTPNDLLDALLKCKPNIVHFIGHGEGKEGIYLENENGCCVSVSTEKLTSIFKHYSQSIECVFLNACHSIEQAKEINKHIKYVIGMQNEIEDNTSKALATRFYRALVENETYERAFFDAKLYLEINKLRGTNIPKLLKAKQLQSVKDNKSSLYLQIALFKKEISGKYYTFRAWLYINSNHVREIKDADNITLKGFSKLMTETLESVLFDLASTDKRLTIEFFISKDLLNRPIEHYCPPDDYPIGTGYNVIIRSWERTRNPFLFDRCRWYWKSNKKKLQVIPEHCVIWTDKIEHNIRSKFLNNGIIFFVLTSPPTKEVLIELIKAGTPIILWVRTQYSELETELQKLKKDGSDA